MLKPSLLQLTFACLTLTATLSNGNEVHPEWVRCAKESLSWGDGYLRKSVEIDRPVTAATLRACGDATFVAAFIGGKRVAELEPYDPVLRLDVTEYCGEGELTLAMHLGRSRPAKCAAFVQLDLNFADGSHRTIVTDSDWKCQATRSEGWAENGFDDSSWVAPALLGKVDTRLLIPDERSTDIDVAENYEQWQQAIGATEGTDPATFQLTDGFEIELLRSAQEGEDSWISMAVDPKGRLIIAKEEVGLLRMTLGEVGDVAQVEGVNDTMQECRGLLFVGDDLYVNANNSKGLYLLPANDEDGFGEPELIYASSGGVGHGRNDLTLGPDGKIYSIQGDSVDLPTDCIDYTSPFRAARRGGKTSEGHLLRIDPKTKDVAVIAAGLRNPFGIAFNPQGDCFTYDADAEYDMGSPWYRPTRVNHLRVGGDYGWRGVTKQWPPYYPDHPDNAIPGLDIGKGSPTAVKFGTNSNFPRRYRDALFILDWTYGRIIAVHAIPRGSSYLMSAETFLQGRPLNVTDLDFGPDGSMYFVTGGRQTQSALYRVRYTGVKSSQSRVTRQQRHRQMMSDAAHLSRRKLESMLTEGSGRLFPLLGSDDPWVRTAARNVLERVDVYDWEDVAIADSSDKVALTAMLALARRGDKVSRSKVIERICDMQWQQLSRSWRETATYTLWLCLQEWRPSDAVAVRLRERLETNYPDREFSVTRIMSEILVRLESGSVVGETLKLAAETTKQAEQMHYLFVLRDAKVGWTLDHRRLYFQLLTGTTDYLGGQGMSSFLSQIRTDALNSLSASERDELASVIEASDPNRKPSPSVTTQRPIVEQWTLGKLTAAIDSVEGQGGADRGRQLFAEASCVHCHRVGGYGRLIGPDLTNVSRRFSTGDLLTSILEPSKVISEKYQSMQVITKDGQVFVGLTALGGDYRSTKLRLATNIQDPYAITEIEKSDIEEIRPSQTSWMPNGLLNTLTTEEVVDLLAYLNSGP